MQTFIFDLDNTLCKTEGNNYALSTPMHHRIAVINKLFDEGNYIKIFTARGMTTHGGDITKVYNVLYLMTQQQLFLWGVKYNELIMGKPSGNIIVDDIAINDKDFFKEYKKKGIIVGNFDIIHPGYIAMFQEAKKHCDLLTIALHIDPSLERKDKLSPILSVEDRMNTLSSIKYIDMVIPYRTEQDLYDLLISEHFDIRIAGSDYHEKPFTGSELNIPMYYVDRSHGWSATKLKNKIYSSILAYRQLQGISEN